MHDAVEMIHERVIMIPEQHIIKTGPVCYKEKNDKYDKEQDQYRQKQHENRIFFILFQVYLFHPVNDNGHVLESMACNIKF
jgi:hypothetical protein